METLVLSLRQYQSEPYILIANKSTTSIQTDANFVYFNPVTLICEVKIKESKNRSKLNEEEIFKIKNVWNLKFKERQNEVETCEQKIKELNEQLQTFQSVDLAGINIHELF